MGFKNENDVMTKMMEEKLKPLKTKIAMLPVTRRGHSLSAQCNKKVR